jgi:hypothetical protein
MDSGLRRNDGGVFSKSGTKDEKSFLMSSVSLHQVARMSAAESGAFLKLCMGLEHRSRKLSIDPK